MSKTRKQKLLKLTILRTKINMLHKKKLGNNVLMRKDLFMMQKHTKGNIEKSFLKILIKSFSQ